MKTIIFVRHAKSSWTDFKLTDFQRPLDERGLHDAPMMAKKLKTEIQKLDAIISSPAVRALSTAKYFASEFGLDIQTFDDLYHGLPNDYLEAISELPESLKSVMLFGHNPGLTYVANEIRQGATDNLPTCGVIISKVNKPKAWSEILFRDMNLEKILFPKMY